MIRDAAGNLYGVTSDGGTGTACDFGCGTVFKVDKTGRETILHNFDRGTDGAGPNTVLVADRAGICTEELRRVVTESAAARDAEPSLSCCLSRTEAGRRRSSMHSVLFGLHRRRDARHRPFASRLGRKSLWHYHCRRCESKLQRGCVWRRLQAGYQRQRNRLVQLYRRGRRGNSARGRSHGRSRGSLWHNPRWGRLPLSSTGAAPYSRSSPKTITAKGPLRDGDHSFKPLSSPGSAISNSSNVPGSYFFASTRHM